MTDPMDEFKELLKQNQPPEPRKFAENQAIEAALAKFEKKNAAMGQGYGWWGRLMSTARTVLHLTDGASMKTAYKIGGGLCAATLVVGLLNTSALNTEYQSFRRDTAIPQATSGISSIGALNGQEGEAKRKVEMPQPLSVAPQPSAVAVAPPALPAEKEERAEFDKVLLNPQYSKDDASGAATRAPEPMSIAPAPALPAGTSPALSAAKAIPSQPTDSMKRSFAQFASGATVNESVNVVRDMPVQQNAYHDEGRDKFEHAQDNPLKLVAQEPVSTFSIDVDTASYSFVRATLNQGALPQRDAVRVEEMVNYFPYDYAAPKDKSVPFASSVNVMPTPWNTNTKLIHIGIKGYEIPRDAKPHSNLVFLIDTSGSMSEPNKLPLLKKSLKLLVDSLKPDDTIAIVTYAGSAGVALEPTKVSDRTRILSTIENFNSGGSTAGAEGIRKAYELAQRNFDKHGVNRVILATDGDFNVGITDQNELKSYIAHERESGVFLSVLGFGTGNYNDALMQTLAQNGNGNAAYIDSLSEARKVLVEEAGSTLFTIAKDVKIQVEFNPSSVAEYRLIGYETRMLNREDFNNDKIDAGEIGAGHAVTAIYEITPVGNVGSVDPLRYSSDKKPEAKEKSSEYAFLKIRYKLPKEETSKLITTPIDAHQEVSGIDKASADARFATSVAAFGQLLRGEGMTKDFTYDDIIALAQSAKADDAFGYRAEFINLVRLAKSTGTNKPVDDAQPMLNMIR